MVARSDVDVPVVDPLPPAVDAWHGREPGLLPGPAADAYLDGVDALVLGPRHSGDRNRPAVLDGVLDARNVDPRLSLDRALRGPATRYPVGARGPVRRDLDVHEPLARRHVAVEPWNDQPGREYVRHRQRRVVHADREQRVAAVHRGLDRGA